MAEAGVQKPPFVALASFNKQMAASAIILEVLP
jgi:hypothetical protein